MRKIKVCHVIQEGNPNELLYNSIKFSDHSRFEYSIYSISTYHPDVEHSIAELPVKLYRTHYKKKLQAARVIWTLFRFFRKHKFDVVQTHLFDASLIGLTSAKMAGVPLKLFAGHHSHEVPLYRKKWLTFIDSISSKLADFVIAPSRNMKEIFLKEHHIPERKVKVLNHGFDMSKLRSVSDEEKDMLRTSLGLHSKVIFGAVGRLFWVKDYVTLINSFKDFAKLHPGVVLLIVGDGPERSKLASLIEKENLESSVMLLGKRNDVHKLMALFDVFIHTSIAESFGMVYIEAFAHGRPVISTPVGIAKEIIHDGENGYFIPIGDVNKLITAMNKVLEKRKEWQEISAKNKSIANEFDIKGLQREYDEFILQNVN